MEYYIVSSKIDRKIGQAICKFDNTLNIEGISNRLFTFGFGAALP